MRIVSTWPTRTSDTASSPASSIRRGSSTNASATSTRPGTAPSTWRSSARWAPSSTPEICSTRPARPRRALAEALDRFARLRDAGIPVIAIAGNHSTPRFRSGGSVFEVLQRFGVRAAWERPETFHVDGVAFHAVPHEADEETLRRDIDSLVPDPDADANVLIL